MSCHSLLSALRARSAVDIDSLDSSVASELGPFVDATSNQAIAFAELSKHEHFKLLRQAWEFASNQTQRWPEVTTICLAVEVAQVLLVLRMFPNLTGRFHLQANPVYAYSSEATVRCGERLLALVSSLSGDAHDGVGNGHPDFQGLKKAGDSLCLKVPATWEGLMACQILEKEKNIRTLATTLFTLDQAVLAAEVGCTYVAPYVNELPVHFIPGHKDPAPNTQLIVEIQNEYKARGLSTLVLPASLTSSAECMLLAGAHHITVAPALLQMLAGTEVPSDVNDGSKGSGLATAYPSLFDMKEDTTTKKEEEQQQQQPSEGDNEGPDARASSKSSISYKSSYLHDESGYRFAVTRKNAGREEKKLVDAINIFADMQQKLEELLQGVLFSSGVAGDPAT